MPAQETAPSLERTAASGFLWLSMGNVVRAVVKVAVLAALGRLLAPSDFGLVAAAGVVIWLSTIFSTLGVGPALVQRRELEERHVETGFAVSLGFGLLLAVLVAVAAPRFAALFRMPELAPVLRALSSVFPIAALSLVAESLLQRHLRFRAIAAAELASYAIGYGAVGVVLATLGLGVWSLVGAEIGRAALKSALFLWQVPHAKRLRFDPRAFRDLLGFGAGYTVSGFSGYFASQGDNFVVGRFLGSAALGLYGRAYELMTVPAQALGAMLHKILFPTMSQLQDSPERRRLAYRRGTAVVACVVLPASAATLVLAPEIVLVLLGEQWRGAVAPLQVLACAMYFRVAAIVALSLASSAGAVGGLAWRNVLYAAAVVAGAIVGQRFGIRGVAVGVAVAIVLQFAAMHQLASRIAGVRLSGFLAMQQAGVWLSLLVGLGVWAVAEPLRELGTPPALTLFAAAALGATSALLLVRFAPPALLGAEGAWLAALVRRGATTSMRPLLRRAATPQS